MVIFIDQLAVTKQCWLCERMQQECVRWRGVTALPMAKRPGDPLAEWADKAKAILCVLITIPHDFFFFFIFSYNFLQMHDFFLE